MIRQPTQVRDRVLSRVLDMLEHLRIQVSMLPEPESFVLSRLEHPSQVRVAEIIAKTLMIELGDTSAPKDPRFDKVRRALAKKAPKLKGATTQLTKAEMEMQNVE